IERGDDVFRSKTADFRFAADGRIAGATLVGEPSGRVAVGRFLPPGEPEMRAAHAQLSGAGPLELGFESGTSLRLAGPGDLVVQEEEFSIHAEKELVGTAAADHASGSVDATGSVVLKWKGDDLASDRVKITTTTSAAGESLVEAQSFGPTTAHRK